MKRLVKCLSEGGIFVDAWGNIKIILGAFEVDNTYILERGQIVKKLLTQEELMEESPYSLLDSHQVSFYE